MPAQKLTDRVYVIPGRTNTGIIVVDNNECVIMDTGIDENSGKRVWEYLSGILMSYVERLVLMSCSCQAIQWAW